MASYSIGKVSRLLGLSIEGIRVYEKNGIIHPKREGESEYRKYSYLDITSLLRAKMYRSLGFSLKDTCRLTNESSIDEISKEISQQREILCSEMDYLASKIRFLESLGKSVDELEAGLHEAALRMSPAFYRMEFAKNGEIDFSAETLSLFQEWMNYLPFVRISSRYHGSDVYGGLSIEEDYAHLFSLKEIPGKVTYHPSTLCVYTTVMEEDNGHSSTECIRCLMEYASYHRFTLSEDFIGQTIMGVSKKLGYKRYRQIYVPILS